MCGFVMSFRMEQLTSYMMDFHEIWYLEYFAKICEVQV
jgi:hypothetical protein